MATTPQERLALGVVALLLAAGAAARAFSPRPPAAVLSGAGEADGSVSRLAANVERGVEDKERRSQPLAPGETIDVNTASEAELDRVLGPGQARKIVEWRASNGPFATLDDVDSVPGIGMATIEKHRQSLTASRSSGVRSARPSFQSAASVADWDRSPQNVTRAATSPSGGVVDLNTASVAQLTTLPGIGESLAERIVAWRQAHGRFSSVEALADVSGIGEAKLARLRPLVRATP